MPPREPDRRGALRRQLDRDLARIQRDQWIDDLDLGSLAPREREAFPLVMRSVIRETEHRSLWARRGAVLAGVGATVGTMIADVLLQPIVTHWLHL